MTRPVIAMADLHWRHQQDAARIEERVLEVLRSGCWLGGPVVAEAEQALAELFGCSGAVGVGSGTDALILGLQAMGVQPGQSVGVPALTFFATAGAVCAIGAIPVVLDVDERGLLCGPLPEGLSAVIPVHLFGNRATVAGPVPLLDDGAQAVGTLARPCARLTAISTYPTKLLSGAGNGGFVLGDDLDLLASVRALGSHGMKGAHQHIAVSGHVGRNSRLGALEAAVLLEQLASLPPRIARRRKIATAYDRALPDGVPVRRDADNPVPVYCLRSRQRDALSESLRAAGIQSTVYYPLPLHRQPALHDRIQPTDAPNADQLADELLALPVHAGLDDTAVDRVVRVLEMGL